MVRDLLVRSCRPVNESVNEPERQGRGRLNARNAREDRSAGHSGLGAGCVADCRSLGPQHSLHARDPRCRARRPSLDAHPRTRGESGVAQVKDMRGTIKTVNDRQLVLEAPGTPPTDYAFDLNGCTIRRGQRQTGPSDLVGGDTVSVLYVESGGKLIARMILVPDAETRR